MSGEATEDASSPLELYAATVPDAAPPAYRRFWQLWRERKFFECHEVLEELWRETTGERRLFYNGLIHCAVALYQHEKGNAEGATRQLVRAQVKLHRYSPEYSGVDVNVLLNSVEREMQSSLDSLDARQRKRLSELRQALNEGIGNEIGSLSCKVED